MSAPELIAIHLLVFAIGVVIGVAIALLADADVRAKLARSADRFRRKGKS